MFRILEGIFTWLIFGIGGLLLFTIFAGAYRFACAILANATPGFIECLCAGVIAIISGSVGFVWWLCDSE